MCVQHKWPSANINNRHGKYTVRRDARSSSPSLLGPAPPARGQGQGDEGVRWGTEGRRAAARRGVMEPLSLDNFIIGHWRGPRERGVEGKERNLPVKGWQNRRWEQPAVASCDAKNEGRNELVVFSPRPLDFLKIVYVICFS